MTTPQQRLIALRIAAQASKNFEAGFAELTALVALGTAPDLVDKIYKLLASYNPNVRAEGN